MSSGEETRLSMKMAKAVTRPGLKERDCSKPLRMRARGSL